MKKRIAIVESILLIVLIGGILFWKWDHAYPPLLDYPSYPAPAQIWIGDTKTGEVWRIEDPAERQYLMKNWNSVRVKEVDRFTGNYLEEIPKYRFNIVMEKTGYAPSYELFLLDSPDISSNDQIVYETVSGDNNFTYIKEKIENGPGDRTFTRTPEELESGMWTYLGSDMGGNAYETLGLAWE